MNRLSAPGVRVASVVAPGGYGKTSHLAAWVATEARPVAWVDVDGTGCDPQGLLSVLVRALESVTDFDPADLRPVGATPSRFATIVAPRFGRAVRRCGSPFSLVLDDVHLVTTQSAADLLDALIDNTPDGSMVAMVGRTAPVTSLRRRRVDSDVVEINAADLALGTVEIRRVLDHMSVRSDSLDVARLLADTEGWPVGVRLAGAQWLAETQRGDVPSQGLSGREPDVAEYVCGEWLGGLAPDDRNFLMQVSCLDWLSGPLCNFIADRNDSGDVLHRIFKDHSILTPLDRRAESYRMHPLLRDALRAELERADAAGARSASSKASEWFEASGDVDRAVHQALAAGDPDRAERLVVEHTPYCFTNGRYATVSRWLEAMPRERVLHSASLCLCAAVASLGHGDSEGTRAWMRLGEQVAGATAASDPLATFRLLAFRSLMTTGSEVDAVEDAAKAYGGLPPGIWHASSCVAFGASLFTLDDERAEAVLAEGAEEAAIWGASSIEANCRALLAIIAHANGDTGRARTLARAARRLVVEHGLEHSPSLAIVSAVSALAEAAAGEPDLARTDWVQSRRHLAHLHDISGWTNVQTRIALAHASLLLDDRVGAEVLLNELGECLATQPDATRAHRRAAELAEILRSSRKRAPRGPSSLSTAELRVLYYLPTNLTLGDIGSRLYISRFTVKTHCSTIYRKLAVSSRREAVETAEALGLLPTSVATARQDPSDTTAIGHCGRCPHESGYVP